MTDIPALAYTHPVTIGVTSRRHGERPAIE